MLDGVSLDQLRTFIAAADEGSFSAAGRRLKRAQSVVSQTLANLEGQLGVKLFDRSGRFPMMTDQGRALLVDARAVVGGVDLFKARAKSLAGGLHTELSDLSRARGLTILSPRVWHLGNLQAKHAFLRAGFGFGMMPLHRVETDLASGALVQIRVEEAPPESYVMAMSAIYRTDTPPGPAGRWFIDRLKQEDARPLTQQASRSTATITSSATGGRPPSRSSVSKRKRSR